MAIADAQRRTGYLKGIKLIRLEVLDSDGDTLATPVYYTITTPQAVGIEPETIEGERTELRGGDVVLLEAKEHDVITGYTLTLKDAKFDIEATLHLCGGTLIEETIETTDYNTGWEHPTISEQATRTPCKIEIYVQNFNSGGSQDSYIKYTFYYCIGYAPSLEHNDQEWSTPELTIDSKPNATQATSVYHKEFVDALPA